LSCREKIFKSRNDELCDGINCIMAWYRLYHHMIETVSPHDTDCIVQNQKLYHHMPL
jgi:hypothetical protein